MTKCKYCGKDTEMEATELCDECWMLVATINYKDLKLTARILIEKGFEPDEYKELWEERNAKG